MVPFSVEKGLKGKTRQKLILTNSPIGDLYPRYQGAIIIITKPSSPQLH